MQDRVAPEKALYAFNVMLSYQMDILCLDDTCYPVYLADELVSNIRVTLEKYVCPQSIDELYMKQENEQDPELKGMRANFLIEAAFYSSEVKPGHKLYHISHSVPHYSVSPAIKSRNVVMNGELYHDEETLKVISNACEAISELSGAAPENIEALKIRCILSSLLVTPAVWTL